MVASCKDGKHSQIRQGTASRHPTARAQGWDPRSEVLGRPVPAKRVHRKRSAAAEAHALPLALEDEEDVREGDRLDGW